MKPSRERRAYEKTLIAVKTLIIILASRGFINEITRDSLIAFINGE